LCTISVSISVCVVCVCQSSVIRRLKSTLDSMSLSLGHLMDRVSADTKVGLYIANHTRAPGHASPQVYTHFTSTVELLKTCCLNWTDEAWSKSCTGRVAAVHSDDMAGQRHCSANCWQKTNIGLVFAARTLRFSLRCVSL